MFEKVNPSHPDKLCDRIAGALVDYAYSQEKNPRIAVEVLLGHGKCHIIAETSVAIPKKFVKAAVKRIAGEGVKTDYKEFPQDPFLGENQRGLIRCGDNGIFKGTPVTKEQMRLSIMARTIYRRYTSDGKYILDGKKLIICQSCADSNKLALEYPEAIVNPLGDWEGGPDVDTGATNRKLGSDMGDAVTGGGLHGKDLSKADVSLNIYANIQAWEKGKPVTISCAIGDETADGKPYSEIVETARRFIAARGGFEKFAEWGLI